MALNMQQPNYRDHFKNNPSWNEKPIAQQTNVLASEVDPQFKCGDTLMSCKPLVSALNSKWKSKRCDHCFDLISSETIKRCKCNRFFYCSTVCQNQDKMFHEKECFFDWRRLDQVFPRFDPETDWSKFKENDEYLTHTQLLLRLYQVYNYYPELLDKEYYLPDGKHFTIGEVKVSLQTPFSDTQGENSNSNSFLNWFKKVMQLLSDDYDLHRAFGTINNNILLHCFNFVIRYTMYCLDEAHLNIIGKALYVELCAITHFCKPNVTPITTKGNLINLQVISEKGIKDFNAARIDYQIEMCGGRADELKESLQMRGITCNCQRCITPSQFDEDFQYRLIHCFVVYGNFRWPEFCSKSYLPVEDLITSLTELYGKHHPFISGLMALRFKFDIQLQKKEAFDHLRALGNEVKITHGLNHEWHQRILSICELMKEFEENKKFIPEVKASQSSHKESSQDRERTDEGRNPQRKRKKMRRILEDGSESYYSSTSDEELLGDQVDKVEDSKDPWRKVQIAVEGLLSQEVIWSSVQ